MKDVMSTLESWINSNIGDSKDKQYLLFKLKKCDRTEDLMLFVYMNQNVLKLTMLPDFNNNIHFLDYVVKKISVAA